MAGLIDAGRLRVGIDSVFPWPRASRAHRRAEQGHVQGRSSCGRPTGSPFRISPGRGLTAGDLQRLP
ncbi:zinc-binding dehydrogenase [Streptomyces sp. NPDC006459]|uniref:zinc-binding dehydrogenase n=1 Tax=Streptomyces sp. NPDC006459 TaxID=3154303 RepID=UPI0033A86488